MIVTLIRHTSVDVPPGTCYGFTDVPLKASFPEEAAKTALLLQDNYFDNVYSSPLSRALHLARYCGYPDAITDPRLKEMNFGDWEMQRFDDIQDPNLQNWYDDYLHVTATHGESFMDQFKRVSAFLEELKQKKEAHVAVFAHGGVLICAQIYAQSLTLENAFSSLTPYGGVVEIKI